MREIADQLAQWCAEGRRFTVATVVAGAGSVPRPSGTTMAVAEDGEVLGSVSGGCVEAAVYQCSEQVLTSGEARLERYAFTDEDALAVGLSCGGDLDVLVQPGDPAVLGPLLHGMLLGWPVAFTLVLSGPARVGGALAVLPDSVAGTLGSSGLDAAVTEGVRKLSGAQCAGTWSFGPDGDPARTGDPVALVNVTVFVAAYAAPPRLLIFGANDMAQALCRVGVSLGYRVTICDARAVFATPRRFPEADEVIVEWPHRYLARTTVDANTAVCVLTHAAKFDVPLLEVALRTSAGYVGAMGSRRTHTQRLVRLRDLGLTPEELAKLRSPIGLDLGARTAAETAVSIAAELIQLRAGGTGKPLSLTGGPIHRRDRSAASPPVMA